MIELGVEAMLRRVHSRPASLHVLYTENCHLRSFTNETAYRGSLFTNRIPAVNHFTSGSFLNKIDCKEKKLMQFSKK